TLAGPSHVNGPHQQDYGGASLKEEDRPVLHSAECQRAKQQQREASVQNDRVGLPGDFLDRSRAYFCLISRSQVGSRQTLLLVRDHGRFSDKRKSSSQRWPRMGLPPGILSTRSSSSSVSKPVVNVPEASRHISAFFRSSLR